MLPAERQGDGIVPYASLRGQDFVYVTATSADRHALIAVSRLWRQVRFNATRCLDFDVTPPVCMLPFALCDSAVTS